MYKINLQFCLYLIYSHFHSGVTVNHSLHDNKRHNLLQGTNSDNDGYVAQQYAPIEMPGYQQYLQGNSSYQQMYGYYYTQPYQQQQPTQLWSGSPIVVEDEIQQQQKLSTNIPPTFYLQHSTSNVIRSGEMLPVYSSQPATTHTTTQFNYKNNNNYNNNNNIVYHRDFIHRIDVIPESQNAQEGIQSLIGQQQQQDHQQQFYATNRNLRYHGKLNDVTSSRENNISDYREHFKRYLQNNPHRIKPIF